MSDEQLAKISSKTLSHEIPDMIGEDRDIRSTRDNPRICFGFEVIQDFCDRSIQDKKPINPLILKEMVAPPPTQSNPNGIRFAYA